MVLIVEDTALHREATAALLRNHGYTVRECDNTRDAIAAIGEKRPRVLVLDVVMPGEDGMHVLGEIACHPEWKDLAVIVTTALPDPLPVSPVKATVLRKPFAIEELLATIQNLAPLEQSA